MKNTYTLAFNLFFLITLSLYIFISFYCHPSGDDFAYSHTVSQSDFFTAWSHEYFHWNGRYSSNVFVLINPISMGIEWIWLYKLAPIILIFLTPTTIFFCLKRIINSNEIKNNKLFLFSLLLSLLYLHQMPILSEGIYWYTGAVTYHLANLMTLSLITLNETKDSSKKCKVFTFSLLIPLAIISMGFNEITSLLILIYTSFKLYNSFNNSKIKCVIVFIPVLLGAAAMFLSPGNTVRESNFIDNHDLINSIMMSCLQTVRFFTSWTSSLALLFTSVLYVIGIHNKKLYLKPFLGDKILYTVSLPLVIFLSAFPAYWATGILGQHRTLNIAYFTFLGLWFLSLNTWVRDWNPKSLSSFHYKIVVGILLFIWLDVTFTKNSYHLINDIISGKAKKFNTELFNRYEATQHNTSLPLELPTIKSKPKTLFVLDIHSNPHNWINETYAKYFKKNKNSVKAID